MAHVKVIVGAILACVICANAMPADTDLGSQRPLPGAFLPSESTGRPSFGNPAVTPSRPNRSAESKESAESHEQLSKGSTAADPYFKEAPVRRQATTEGSRPPFRPLASGSTTVRDRRDATTKHDDRRQATTESSRPSVRPLPGAAATTRDSNRREATTKQAAPSGPVRPLPTRSSNRRDATTAQPPARPLPAALPTRSDNRREEATTVRAGARPAATTQASKDRREEPSTARPSAVRPLPTSSSSPKAKRQVQPSTGSSSGINAQLPAFTAPPRPLPIRPVAVATTAAAKDRREAADSSSTARVPQRPLLPGRPVAGTTASSKDRREAADFSTTAGVPQRPLLPARPAASTAAPIKDRREAQSSSSGAQQPLRPLPTSRPSVAATTFKSSFGGQSDESSETFVSYTFRPLDLQPSGPGGQSVGTVVHGTVNRPGSQTSFLESSVSSQNPQAGSSFSSNSHSVQSAAVPPQGNSRTRRDESNEGENEGGDYEGQDEYPSGQ